MPDLNPVKRFNLHAILIIFYRHLKSACKQLKCFCSCINLAFRASGLKIYRNVKGNIRKVCCKTRRQNNNTLDNILWCLVQY